MTTDFSITQSQISHTYEYELAVPEDAQEAVVYVDPRDGEVKKYSPSECIQIATISTKPSPRRVLLERVAFIASGAIIASIVWWLAVWYFT